MVGKDYEKLIEFITYFEDDTIEFCRWQSSEKHEDGTHTMPYPIYDEKFNDFIDECYRSDLMMPDYLEYIKRFEHIKIDDLIKDSDIDLLKAVFTYKIRAERFCDGSWSESIKNKVFLDILYRLRELINE